MVNQSTEEKFRLFHRNINAVSMSFTRYLYNIIKKILMILA